MDENKLNVTVRMFLKEVGVTSQRAVEKAVREAISAGRLKGTERLAAKMTLEISVLGLRHEIDGHIELA